MAARKPPAEPDETSTPEESGPDQSDSAQPETGARGHEYVDGIERTYYWPDGPQTVERGDVVALPEGWANDGRFAKTAKKPTRLRDNHADQRKVTAERQTKARDELHARLAKEGE
jgi:hypothetical protein